MKIDFVRAASVEPALLAFDRDRALIDRLRPAISDEQKCVRWTIGIYPTSEFVPLSISEVLKYIAVLPPGNHRFTSFPDRNSQRTTSLSVIGGNPFTSYVGASGFISYFRVEAATGNRNRVIYPHWWYAGLKAALYWAGTFYQAANYEGTCVCEIELESLDGLGMVFNERNDVDTHLAMESDVSVRIPMSVERLTASADDVAVDLTSATAAAFNWVIGFDELKSALES